MTTTKRKLSGKPVIAMGEVELMQTFDQIGDDLNDQMMTEARLLSVSEPVVFAAVVLVSSDGSRRFVTYVPEYGDSEGIEQMLDFARQLRRTGKVGDGESVEAVIMEKPFDQFQWRPL